MSRTAVRSGDRIITGAQYVEQITARKSDRQARTAFQELALSLTAPGAALFDFGSGTGLDAYFYAEQGRRVTTYDIDPRMSEYLAGHCRTFIRTGQITLLTGGYAQFLETAMDAPIELVTANFAPLNLIADLAPLFAKFHALTGPGGRVLASVLSPYFYGDLRYGWWWRNLWQLWRDGHYSVPGTQAAIFRRTAADFATQCAPHFSLVRVYRGLPGPHSPGPNDHHESAPEPARWLRGNTSRFIFLLFQRR